MVPAGVIEVSFDPLVRVGELAIRWQTIGVTVALLAALALAARICGYLPPRRPPAEPVSEAADRLRLDDLAYIVLGSVPGAVAGGRLVHAAAFWEAYAAEPERILDPAVGSLSLLGAVLGGTVSAAYVAYLLGGPIRRWADAAAVPLLLAIGLGKLAQFLGGSGQGAPFDGEWAVAFVGPGPWHSLNPAVPAHPAQVYEGLWALLGIPLLIGLVGPGRDLARALHPLLRRLAGRVRSDGLLFAATLAWFALGRTVIGFTWRDDLSVGPLNGEQSVALAVLVLLVLGLAVGGLRRRRRRRRPEARSAPA